MITGILTGLALGFGNYFVVKKLVLKLLQPGVKKLALSLIFVFKMLCLLGLVAMCFSVFKVDVMSFVLAYASTLLLPVLMALWPSSPEAQMAREG